MGVFQGWSQGLKFKLLLLLSVPVAALLFLGFFMMGKVNYLSSSLDEAHRVGIPKFEQLGGILAARNGMNYYIWQAMYFKDKPEKVNKIMDNADENFKKLKDLVAEYEASERDQVEIENWKKFLEVKDSFYKLTEENLKKVRAGQIDDALIAELSDGAWHKQVTELRLAVQANTKNFQVVADQKNAEQASAREETKKFSWLVLLGSLIVIAGSTLYLGNKISSGVSHSIQVVMSSVSQLNDALAQLSTSGQVLSDSAASSAASLEETVASLEELTSMVSQNSDNAKSAAGLSIRSRDTASTGEIEMENLNKAMEEITNSSKKIQDITVVIDDIAFQTNLLALNASVEAARAGEQGKGFAVVADAVRTLAQRAGVAAKDISVLIQESTAQVEKGSQMAQSSGRVLSQIVESVKKVSDINTEISAASAEQSTGIKQISVAMNNLDKSTQTNAASSEEIAASTTEIFSQAEAVKEAMSELEQLVIGKRSA